MIPNSPEKPNVTTSRLAENAAKLAALEPEWGVLGPIREIHFRYRFGKKEAAESFAAQAAAKGCQHQVAMLNNIEWTVDVSKRMEPSAANVTLWQESLDPLAAAYHFYPDSNDENA